MQFIYAIGTHFMAPDDMARGRQKLARTAGIADLGKPDARAADYSKQIDDLLQLVRQSGDPKRFVILYGCLGVNDMDDLLSVDLTRVDRAIQTVINTHLTNITKLVDAGLKRIIIIYDEQTEGDTRGRDYFDFLPLITTGPRGIFGRLKSLDFTDVNIRLIDVGLASRDHWNNLFQVATTW